MTALNVASVNEHADVCEVLQLMGSPLLTQVMMSLRLIIMHM